MSSVTLARVCGGFRPLEPGEMRWGEIVTGHVNVGLVTLAMESDS